MVACRAMATSFAALIYRSSDVSDRALSHGFAVALAGWDVPAPTLVVTELRALPGFSVAFYRSGAKAGPASAYEEIDHVAELFEDELTPGLSVRDAAGGGAVVIYTLVYAEDAWLDDGVEIGAHGFERRFVREGEDGLEAGHHTPDEAIEVPLEIADEADLESIVRPHRGSTFVGAKLGVAILPALVAALYDDGRRVPVRLVEPGPASIERETVALVGVLGRERGRASFDLPADVAHVETPPTYAAFVRSYDFADPSDPHDLYRELSIGAIVGTLRFHRAEDLARASIDAAWATAARAGLFPIASLRSSALGGSSAGPRTIALASDHDALVVVDEHGSRVAAGPTFGELLRYLSLGFKARDEIEEDVIGALMLRAKLRADA